MSLPRMELSSVYNRIHYLVALKNAQQEDRITILQNITPGQLDCLGEKTYRIYDQTFPLLVQDLGYFDDRSLVLRSYLRIECLSVERKQPWFIITGWYLDFYGHTTSKTCI